MSDTKINFYEKLSELVSKKAKNATFLTKNDYNKILLRLTELNQNPQSKKEHSDFRLLQRYEILEFECNGATIKRLVKAETQLQIVCLEVVVVLIIF